MTRIGKLVSATMGILFLVAPWPFIDQPCSSAMWLESGMIALPCITKWMSFSWNAELVADLAAATGFGEVFLTSRRLRRSLRAVICQLLTNVENAGNRKVKFSGEKLYSVANPIGACFPNPDSETAVFMY